MTTMSSRIKVLDGLRGLAVLLVILFHAHRGTENTSVAGLFGALIRAVGWSGVDLFFVLSGFLITGILVRARDGGGAYFKPFYMRRLLRVFPLYYLALFLCLVIAPLFGLHLTSHGWTYWVYMSNYGAIAYGSDLELNHLWSLSVEEHFYMVWPLLVFLTPPRHLMKVMIAAASLAFAARLGHALAGHRPVLLWICTHTRFDALAVGGILSLWLPTAAPARAQALAAGLLAGGFVGLATLGPRVGDWQHSPVALALGFSLYAAFYSGLLVATLNAHEDDLLHRVFSSRLLRELGKYSYSMYVFHPFIDYAIRGLGLFPGTWPGVVGPHGVAVWAALAHDVVLVGLSLLVAVATWKLFEERLLTYKDRWPYGA